MDRFDYEKAIPKAMQALAGVHQAIEKNYTFDRSLYHLVLLRASQMNHCGFCVEMHTREARMDAETNERLDQLVVFEHSEQFSEKEKLALRWTEALTRLAPDTDYADLRGRVRNAFSDEEFSVLTTLIGMINLWNRIGVSRH